MAFPYCLLALCCESTVFPLRVFYTLVCFCSNVNVSSQLYIMCKIALVGIYWFWLMVLHVLLLMFTLAPSDFFFVELFRFYFFVLFCFLHVCVCVCVCVAYAGQLWLLCV